MRAMLPQYPLLLVNILFLVVLTVCCSEDVYSFFPKKFRRILSVCQELAIKKKQNLVNKKWFEVSNRRGQHFFCYFKSFLTWRWLCDFYEVSKEFQLLFVFLIFGWWLQRTVWQIIRLTWNDTEQNLNTYYRDFDVNHLVDLGLIVTCLLLFFVM